MQSSNPQYTSTDYFNAANAHMAKKEPKQALSICVLGLEQAPEDVKLLSLAAQSCIAMGHLREARLYLEKAMAGGVGVSLVHETFADLLLLEGAPGEAVKSYRQAASLNPDRALIQDKIDRARKVMSENRPVHGKRRQVMGFPEEMARAVKLQQDGKHREAEDIFRNILRRDPEHVEAMRMLAGVAVTHRKHADAEVFLRQATTIAPDYARLWLDLASAQMEQEKIEEAITSARRLVELTPDMAESHIALGNALARIDRAAEAIESYRAALQVSPAHPGAFSGLGQQLKTLGRQEESIAVHRENILRNPENAEPYWSLANMKTFRFTDHEISSMEHQVEREEIEDLAFVQFSNALGFAYEGRKDYDKAFYNIHRGNQRRRATEVYDPVETEVFTDQLIETFTEEFLSKNAGYGSSDAAPIFIVGLPRSGSTLLEQVLASHSTVEGTHELSDLAQVVRSMPKLNAKKDRFPNNLPGLKPEMWARVGEQYLQRTEKYRSGAPHFIDKNPNNFVYAGLIALAMPNAKIINARRHPLDSCFGSYKQLFAQGQPFTYDLTEVGEYYLQYQRLMDHWHTVMPGRVLDVQYENVVADLDSEVHRILGYCELPFEESCLNFHQTERAVKTASSEQVRQPIYSSSVNLWKNYQSHLDELVEVLEPLL